VESALRLIDIRMTGCTVEASSTFAIDAADTITDCRHYDGDVTLDLDNLFLSARQNKPNPSHVFS
jgi:hypothetical protein